MLSGFFLANAQDKISGEALYSQMDEYNYSMSVYSFEYPNYPSYDIFAADDFEVPVGASWEIYSVRTIFNVSWTSDVTITIYDDNSGMPGDTLHNFPNLTDYEKTVVEGYNTFEFEVVLPSLVTLTEGTYWICFTNNGDMNQWVLQTSTDVFGNKTHWKNPGGAWGYPTSWEEIPSDFNNGNGLYYNASFALHEAPVDYDLAAIGFSAPVTGELTAADSVTIQVQNFGFLPQINFDVYYIVDGGTAVVETVTDSIYTGEVLEYTFSVTADLSALGDHSVEVAVLLDTDESTANDVFVDTVINYGTLYDFSDSVITACSGLFTDDGGVVENLTVDGAGTLTIYPENAGDRAALTFTEFDLGYGEHAFRIYDGESTDAPVLYTYHEEEYQNYNEFFPAPEFVKARNAAGALTIELIPYSYYSDDGTGWLAEVSCVTPDDIDFIALDIAATTPIIHQFMSAEVVAHVVNSGGLTTSRNVYFYENGVAVDTVMTDELAPGEVQEFVFTWLPQNAGEVAIMVSLEDDVKSINDDNSVSDTVTVYGQYALVESFEGAIPPELWKSTDGKVIVEDYYYYHGVQSLEVPYNGVDTLITPLLSIADNDSISMFVRGGYNKWFEVLYSETDNGPWIVIDTITAPDYDWTLHSVQLGSLAGSDYHIALAFNNNIYIDFVTGPNVKYFDNDLFVGGFEVEQFPSISREAFYSLSIKNIGYDDVAVGSYSVNLYDATNDAVLVSLEGKALASFYEITYDFVYTFDTEEEIEVYAEIVFEADERTENNMSGTETITVQPEGTFNFVTPGEVRSYGANLFPMANNYSYGLSEMMYYPEEVQGNGDITGFTFTYYTDNTVSYVPITIYMGTTTDSILPIDGYNAIWIESDTLNMKQVYNGTVNFVPTSGTEMYIELDSVFAYDGTENLIIMIDKGMPPIGGNMVNFVCFDPVQQVNYRGYNVYSNDIDVDPADVDPTLYCQKYNYLPLMRFFMSNEGAPEFTSEPVNLVAENAAYAYDVEVAYNGIGTLAISEGNMLPDWMTVTDNGDNTASLVGTTDVLGVHDVQLLASDGTYSATQTFAVTVGAVPSFTSASDTLMLVNDVYSYNITTSYNGADILSITTSENLPTWLTLTDNGDNTALLTGTPVAVGTFNVELDAEGEFFDGTQTFTIIVDDQPVFASTADTVVAENVDYTYNVDVTYAGVGTLAITAGTDFPAWLTLTDNGDNTATVTGSTTELAIYPVEILAGDGMYSASQTFYVHVDAIPEITSTPETAVEENVEYTYTVEVTYAGIGTLAITAGTEFPTWLTLTDNGDNTATVIGTTADLADYNVDVVASTEYFSETQSFVVTVAAVPVFTSDAVLSVEANVEYVYDVVVSYNGTEVVEIVAGDNMPTWLTLTDNGNNTATLSGTTVTVGQYDVDIVANGDYFSTTQSFVIDVVTGVFEINNLNVSIYPNPANDFIIITKAMNAKVEIFDVTGNRVIERNVISEMENINIEDLDAGIYIIRVSNSKGTYSNRLIIK